MTNPFEKIRRSFRFYYHGRKNGWSFPPGMAHLSGGKMAAGSYEPGVSRAVAENLEEGDLFIDVGSNVGYFARLAAGTTGPEGRVYAFEADYENYHALVRNLRDHPNAHALHMALSDENAFTMLNRSSHSACHSMVDTGNELVGSQCSVPCLTLDHFWEVYLDKRPVRLVKIDVEGAELMVLAGMERFLAEEAAAAMIIEFCPAILRNAGFRAGDFYEKIASHFSISVIGEEYRGPAGKESIDTAGEFRAVEKRMTRQEGAVTVNLMCRRPA